MIVAQYAEGTGKKLAKTMPVRQTPRRRYEGGILCLFSNPGTLERNQGIPFKEDLLKIGRKLY